MRHPWYAFASLSTSEAPSAPVAELRKRGAGSVRHGRSTLLAHLEATRALLEHWGQCEHVALAGLFHSIYSTDVFAPRLFALDERERVRAIIGAQAERLVYLFCALPRRELFGALAATRSADAPQLRLQSRRPCVWVTVTPGELGELAVLHLANAAEQSAREDGQPGEWLAWTARIARAMTPLLDCDAPLFSHWRTIDADCEHRLRAGYETAWLPQQMAQTTSSESDPTGEAFPVAEPYIARAFHALAEHAGAPIAPPAATGCRLIAVWGTAWDKRLTAAQWRELALFVAAAAQRPDRERAQLAEQVRSLLAAGTTPQRLYRDLGDSGSLTRGLGARAEGGPDVPLPEATLPPRFATYIARLADDAERPRLGRYPGLTARPWHDPAQFPLAQALEANAAAVVAEMRALGAADFHPETEDIARTGAWDVRMLFERGRRHERACAACPVTTALIEGHETIRGLAGLAYVSRLGPHTEIAAHRGPTNLRLRCHFGITIPDAAGVIVGGEPGCWTPGKCLVFDDSFEHAAWNHSESDRLVLVIDLWHPDLSARERDLLAGLHRYAQGHAENLARYWARNERAGRPPRFD